MLYATFKTQEKNQGEIPLLSSAVQQHPLQRTYNMEKRLNLL